MFEIIGLSIALAMDAFAVSCGVGLMLGKPSKRQIFRISWHFGLFQFLMPLIGWYAGNSVSDYFVDAGKFVAFAALALIGAKMLWEAHKGDEEVFKSDPTKGLMMVGLSLAVSIDALVVGFSLKMIGSELLFPAIVIGIVASAFSLVGLHVGKSLAGRLERIAYIFGGVLLISIGISSLF